VCGFILAYAQTRNGLPDNAQLDRMDAVLAHRGPDASGAARFGRAAMRHRRLAIVGLGGGRQPACTADGRVWLVFNGEIYNFREIRAELKDAGYALETESDTEVLLHAYLAWGERCLARLNGMFAFAVYDGRLGSVFAARDRFGEKPLYVLESHGALYLASELKALVEGGLVDKRLDPVAVYNFFATSYIIGPRTIFQGVRRLPAGHWLKANGAVVEERAYWQPPAPTEERTDESGVVREALDLLRDSIRLRLVADVPVGMFLSGGVDSSAIVALAAEVSGQRLDTFSVGFAESSLDEREHARFVAKKFNTRHHELVLEPAGVDIVERIAWHTDEPFADTAALPTWHLAELARRHVKVALSGDGGDEIFAGYDSYRGHVLSERLKLVPAPLRNGTAAALRALPVRNARSRFRLLRLARNIDDAGLDAGERFVAKQQAVFRREELAAISPRLAVHATAANDRAMFAPLFDSRYSALAGMTVWQQSVSLVDDMLVKADRMSMAHSLEVRAPFLDHRLAELMNRVAFATKLPNGRQKYVLRTAMAQYFPAEFLWRPKQGFVTPLNHWFRGDLGTYVAQTLLASGAVVRGLFGVQALERIVAEHQRLERDRSTALWALLMFETWCRRYRIGPEAFAI
jgi:asparagine synthase (glutamine-hydrolysing)